ncbi:MAG: hypothetical protein WA777_19660 [Rhodanobacter sp.]
MKKSAYILILCLALAGCYSTNDAKKAMEAQGFTNIEVTGHAWFACSEDDTFATSFTATNPQGKKVSGAVCSGMFFKNATVRW